MQGGQATEIKAGSHGAQAPMAEMELYFTIHKNGEGYILHDRPFEKPLAWVEYDRFERRLDFVTEDGTLHQYGIYVNPRFVQYLTNKDTIAVVLIRDGYAVDGYELPLVKHT